MIWNEQDWNIFLDGHPMFDRPKDSTDSASKSGATLELSLSSLPDFADRDTSKNGPAPSGRRQLMVIKESDIIIAVGTELRLASLRDNKTAGMSASGSGDKSYKVCACTFYARVVRILTSSNYVQPPYYCRFCIRQMSRSRFARWPSTRMRSSSLLLVNTRSRSSFFRARVPLD